MGWAGGEIEVGEEGKLSVGEEGRGTPSSPAKPRQDDEDEEAKEEVLDMLIWEGSGRVACRRGGTGRLVKRSVSRGTDGEEKSEVAEGEGEGGAGRREG